jgi:ATP-dependent helicase/nuclease subunit A
MSKQMPNDLIDGDARRRAIDVHRSAIVQAPAGSGKTELLTQRFLALLAIAERPEEIVALTFTRKAAAEMQDRILRALAIAGGEPQQPNEEMLDETLKLAASALARDHERNWELLRNPAQLRIHTIDALCLELARRSPLHAPLATRVLDDAGELYAEAARATVRELAGNDAGLKAAIRCVLLHLDGDVGMLRDLLGNVLGRRDQWQRHIPPEESCDQFRRELEQALQHAVRRALQAARNAFLPGSVAQLPAVARFAVKNGNQIVGLAEVAELHDVPSAEAADLPLWLAIRNFLFTGKNWRKKVDTRDGFPAGSAEKAEMQALLSACSAIPELGEAFRELEYLPPAQLDERQWKVGQALFRILPRSVELLQESFAERDISDFAEIAHAARRVTRSSRAGIRHLLVDEYQDTSLTQQKLFEMLVAPWQPGDGRTLFLVGDPMQSIYRFRQAEVELFLETWRRRKLASVKLDPLGLSANFRSQPQIVDWVNQTFSTVFGKPQSAFGAVSFTDSFAQRRIVGPQVEVVADVQFKNALDDSDEREATHVAKIIQRERSRNSAARIAVLVRAREHLARIIPELRSRGIPFVAVEIEKLGETQIVRDLLALTRALLHPADRVAWLAVLRAPWCGLELGDLEIMCGEESKACVPDLIARRQSLLGPDAQLRLGRAAPVLDAARALRGRRPLARLVEGTWIALGGPACLPAADRPNLEGFLQVLQETELGGDVADWQLLKGRTEKLFAQHASLDPNPVELMTIHKAKGLEFDAVLLPGLGKRAGRDDEQLLRWMERNTEDGPELLLAPAGAKGEDTDPLFRYLRHIDRQFERQESRRVAYVASTRARESLYLLGCANAKLASGGQLHVAAARNSLLETMWPALHPHFEYEAQKRVAVPGMAPAGLTIAAQAETADTLLRLPANWEFPAPPADVRRAAAIAPREPVSFEWASDLRRHAGTVIHAMLQRIAGQGMERWNTPAIAASRHRIANLLRREGVAREDLSSATEEVAGALQFTLSDERGRWCLGSHHQAESEFEMTGIAGAAPRHIRIDRTFVADGVRWIIDFKTGWHEGAGRERFFDEEVERYREQLEGYATLLRPIETRPIRIGIFFPLARGWREWEPPVQVAGAGAT